MTRAVLSTAIGAAILALYVVRLDPAAGLYVDDAWYIVLAESLWRGEGFRLISSATTPILPAFPPGFAMILAPVVGLTAHFPDNVAALKTVSIVAMLGVGVCAYLYVVRWYGAPRPVAAIVATVTVILPAFVFLATSTVMAEPVFTLSQLLLALAVERAARSQSEDRLPVVVSGLIAGAGLLIRLAGIAGMAGAAMYLFWHRGWKSAATFVAVLTLCYAPWAIYSWTNTSPPAERAAHGGSIAYGYEELLLMRRGGEPSSGRATLPDVARRVAFNAFNIFGQDTGALIFPAAYRGADESGMEVFQLTSETGFRASGMGGYQAVVWVSSTISLIMLAGFIAVVRRRLTAAECLVPMTIAMVLVVPARTFRYVLPLSPFLIFYFFSGLDALARLVRRGESWGATVRIAAACVIALMVFEHAQYVSVMRAGPTPPWLRDYAEVKAATDWMRANLKREGPIATSNPGLVYLTTGRKTVALTNLRGSWLELQNAGVPYGATLRVAERPPASLGFPVIYESPRLKLWVVELPAKAPIDSK